MQINLLIENLYSLKLQYNLESSKQKHMLLEQIANEDFKKIKDILNFHDMLLFIKAYPDNPTIETLAKQCLVLLSQYILSLHNNNNNLDALNNTGIAHTKIEAAYNFDILRVMISKYLFFLEFDSFGADDEAIFNAFNVLVSDVEQAAFTDEDFDIKQWLAQSLSANSKDKLVQIINLIDDSGNNERVKTNLFLSLKMYVRVNLNEQFSRSFLKAPFAYNAFYTSIEGMLKDCNFRNLIQQPLQSALVLSDESKQKIVDISQVQLFTLLRELDGITYTEDNSVEVLPLERGLYIALMYQKRHKRNVIESLVGVTIFKNGVPISYCAFWLLGHTAKVAFNIFEAFRGGESKFVFSQLIRVLVNHFNVHRLVIEPYQFGKNNEEAILSGAFWFYYKLGFRHKDNALQNLADKEYQKIMKGKGYKSPTNILERLAEKNIELTLTTSSVPHINATEMSLYMSHLVQEKFNGNRLHLENIMSKEMLEVLEIKILSSNASLTETESFKKTSILFYDIMPIIKTWNDVDKQALFYLMKIKLSGSEREFVLNFQQHKNLNYALFDMIQKRPNKLF